MSHRNFRSATVVSGLFVAATLLAACGSGTPGAAAGESSDTTGGTGGADVVTVEMWQDQFAEADNAWYAEQVKAFNAAHDDVQIKLVVVPGDAWEQKMKAAQAAGTTPDMYTLNYSEVQPKARGGELAPLTELISADAWADVDQRFLDAVTVDSYQYAYPLLFEPSSLFFYRTDLFQEAGLDPDSPPTTWDELIDATKALKAASPDVVPFQTAQNAVELSWTTWGLQHGLAGHFPISDDWSTSLITDPAYRPLFETYQRLMQEGALAKQPLSAYGDATPLGEGKLAMMVSGSWAISLLVKDYPDMIPNLAVAPMPAFDGDQTKPTGTLGGWTIGVDAKSEHQKEAAEAISWLLAEDVDVPLDYFVKTDFTKFSPRASVMEAIVEADTGVNPWLNVMVEEIAPYQVLEATYDWSVSLAIGTALEKVMQGGDVTAAIEEADATITKSIADLDLPSQLTKRS